MKINVEFTTEHIESKGGLLLAGQLAAYMGLSEITSGVKGNAGEVLTHLLGLLVQGQTNYEAMNSFRHNEFFKESFGLTTLYSAETVRLYLDALSKDAPNIMEQVQECSNRLLGKAHFTGVRAGKTEYIPIDIDTSPMDNSGTKKENIGYTYKGFVGYHPIFAYIGLEGYMLSCQMRPGSQHCQKGTPEFIKGLTKSLPEIIPGQKVLFRLDSGNDSLQTIQALLENKNHYLIIKRNLRLESREWWLEEAKKQGKAKIIREGKTRYTGRLNIQSKVTDAFPRVAVVYEVIERTIDRDGNINMFPDIEVNTFWTNLKVKAETVIELYHAHGTMEQYHSELKTDMGLERFPSGKYAVNQIILSVAMAAFNILRHMGQSVIKEKQCAPFIITALRKRLGTVIRDLMCLACKIVKHSGYLTVKVFKDNPWFLMYRRLNTLYQTL